MAGVGSAVRRLYLSAYNWVVFYGWAQVLYYAITALLGDGHEGVYAAVERPLQLAQTAAVMEILHGLVAARPRRQQQAPPPGSSLSSSCSSLSPAAGPSSSALHQQDPPPGSSLSSSCSSLSPAAGPSSSALHQQDPPPVSSLSSSCSSLSPAAGPSSSALHQQDPPPARLRSSLVLAPLPSLILATPPPAPRHTGLVRSPVTATLPQIGSRLFLTWGILWSFPETQSHILVSSLVISWSITEIIRYSFFGLKETLGFAPSWLLWLRYSTFMILYPTGIFSEVSLIYIALPYMKVSERYFLKMPNKWNFSFDYFYTCVIAIGVYIPGGPHMFTYMLAQRKKALSKAKTA